MMSKPRILMVEDDQDSAQILEKILIQFGLYEVDYANGAEAGLRLAEQKVYDLIISDYNMPGLPRPTFITEVRSETINARTPVVALTGSDMPTNTLLALGFTEVCRKPVVDVGQFLQDVARWLAAGPHVSKIQ
jgi:CheY-like chemotaxis protein